MEIDTNVLLAMIGRKQVEIEAMAGMIKKLKAENETLKKEQTKDGDRPD